jgi:hypothetical protein
MLKFLYAAAVALLAGVPCPGPRAAEPPPGEWDRLWADLGTRDPETAERAIAGLAARPAQAVPFLEGRLRPVPHADPRRVAGWLADLDSEEFAVRERADWQLGAMGEVAEPFLKQALHGRPSAEVRRHIDGLLAAVKANRLDPPAERLRAARAVEALERIGDRAARRLLADWAGGAPEAPLTIEAKSALERVTTGNSAPP